MRTFTNFVIPSDTSGTFQWRAMWPLQNMYCHASELGLVNSILHRPCAEPEYYQNINMLMVQRQVGDQNFAFFTQIAKPASLKYNFHLVYNIDDLMSDKHIPKYNRGHRAYLGQKTQEQLRFMLNESDFVLTTTDYIKGAYNREYGVPLDNIICIPNFLPKWWIGGKVNLPYKLEMFKKNKGGRLRVGVVSSLSHFNIDRVRQLPDGKAVYEVRDKATDKLTGFEDEERNPISLEEGIKLPLVQDDYDLIHDTVIATANRYQWVFMGYLPPKLEELVKSKVIEHHPGTSILNYPEKLRSLDLNVMVAPCIDNEFNRCKSNIKWLEACALGIPLLASDITAYQPYMPAWQLFKSADELKDKLDKFAYMSAKGYASIIDSQWKWLNSPTEECGLKLNNWWLEANMGSWINLFQMKNRGVTVSFRKYREKKAKLEEQSKREVVFEDKEQGIEIVR